VELNPVVHEEICTQTFELPVVRERQQRENKKPESDIFIELKKRQGRVGVGGKR
jgi:hypothetical protein